MFFIQIDACKSGSISDFFFNIRTHIIEPSRENFQL